VEGHRGSREGSAEAALSDLFPTSWWMMRAFSGDLDRPLWPPYRTISGCGLCRSSESQSPSSSRGSIGGPYVGSIVVVVAVIVVVVLLVLVLILAVLTSRSNSRCYR
jgi:hypothetical protein